MTRARSAAWAAVGLIVFLVLWLVSPGAVLPVDTGTPMGAAPAPRDSTASATPVEATGTVSSAATDDVSPPPVPTPDPELPINFVIRNCWDGARVPNLQFRLGREGAPQSAHASERVFTSDENGVLTAKLGVLKSLRLIEKDWELAIPGHAWGGAEDHSIWVFRRVEVRVRVRFAGGASGDASRVDVRAIPVPSKESLSSTEVLEHRSDGWLNRSGMDRRHTALRFDASSGVHSGTVPLVRDLGVRATAEGLLPGYGVLDMDSAMDGLVEGEVTLQPGLYVSGRLTVLDRVPQGRLRVHAFSLIRTDAEGFQKHWMRGGGFTVVRGPDGDVKVRLRETVSTDEQGRFSIDLRGEGRLVLVVWEEGLAPKFLDLGELRASQRGIELNLTPPESSGRVRLLWQGKPVSVQQLYLYDITLRDIQPGQLVPVDGKGTIPAEWFAVQRDYGLGLDGPLAGEIGDRCLIWSGQAEVELSSLPLVTDILSR